MVRRSAAPPARRVLRLRTALVAAFADSRRLGRIVVPLKWILELPRPFSRRETSHALIVEQLDLLSDSQTKAAYRSIDPNVLGDLCVVLFHFRGMDSIAKNIPVVSDGRIGLIDTEHWDRSTSKPYLHRVGEHLSKDRSPLQRRSSASSRMAMM